ncbi:MAG: hypothetical protein GC162_13815 [Planctomycetes bacterium]|nr:hypothetical protein [Planctomycetota bacterium]
MLSRRELNKRKTLSLADRRRFGRIRQAQLKCNLGTVLDLSAGGLRMISDRPLDGTVDVQLANPAGLAVTVKGVVAWRERMGFRKHLVGIEFTDTTPDINSQLSRIAMTAAHY